MKRSDDLYRRALRVAPGGVHSPVRAFKSVGGSPLFFKSAHGAFLTTVDGASMVDFCQSFGPHLLGHRDSEVSQVVHETVELAWSFGACEPYSLELAEWICAKVPWVEKIRFVNSGTEAVMSALRLARAVTGRSKILKFNGCYHGHVDSLLVKAGSGLAGGSTSDSAGISQSDASSTLVSELNDEEGLVGIMDRYGSDIAAVIIEPLPANYGLLVQRPEFIRMVCHLAHATGSLVIFDEVISGFRVAMGGMAEVLGIKPDLVTYGKVIGGGFPVGAYGGPTKWMDQIAPQGPVYQAGTLSANPVGMRAGLATLLKAESLGLHGKLNERTKSFAAKSNEIFRANDCPLEMESFASLFWLHARTDNPPRSVGDLPPNLGEVYRDVFYALLGEGIYLAPSGYEVAFLSWAHGDELLDDVLLRMERGLRRIYD